MTGGTRPLQASRQRSVGLILQVDEAAKTDLHPEALVARLLLCTPPASDGSRRIARNAENTGNTFDLRWSGNAMGMLSRNPATTLDGARLVGAPRLHLLAVHPIQGVLK